MINLINLKFCNLFNCIEISNILIFLCNKKEAVTDDDGEYDYGYEYSYEEKTNVCNENDTIYDMDNNETCKNKDFLKLPHINNINKLVNYKQCCKSHEYLYKDECTVRRRKIF